MSQDDARETYAATLAEFHEWCEAHPELNFNFKGLLAGFCRLLMGGGAPATGTPPDRESRIERLLRAVTEPPKPAPPELPKPPTLPRGRRPNPGSGHPGRWFTIEGFPGRVFSGNQVRAKCGVTSSNLTPWIKRGTKVGGRHVVRYATKQEIDAALGAAAVSKPSPRKKGARS